DLEPNGKNQIMFGNLIRSNGFSIDCLFYKRSPTPIEVRNRTLQLELSDFEFNEVQNYYKPVFVDLGRKVVFAAAEGLSIKAHSLLRCTIREYYHMTGSTRYQADQLQQKRQNGVEAIESHIPSHKRASQAAYIERVQYILTHLDVLYNFYGSSTAKSQFFLYQRCQKVPEQTVNILIHEDSKYSQKRRKKKAKKKKQEEPTNPKTLKPTSRQSE
ncbi:hypothetical protein J3Q64DRAFT_1649201, partial [Phycomyces blakesleeanus]